MSLSQGFPHLQGYVDRGVITRGMAAAMIAYAADVGELRKSESRTERRRPGQEERPGYSMGVEQTRKRVRAADAAMGDGPKHVVHLASYRGLDLAEIAVDLGHPYDEVRVLLVWGARALLRVYRECVEA